MQIFDYEDIVLMPRMCLVSSRSECSTEVTLGPRTFKLPIVPANMKSVINEELAVKLASSNYFYVMHRFNIDPVEFARNMRARGLLVSISIGVQPADYLIIDELAKQAIGADYVTIDIAHGHAESVRKLIAHVKENLPDAFVIAGNVGTPEAVADLESWGADCTKIGIGPGRVCITKLKTGFGTGGWQLSAVKWCASVATKPIIADGGIQCHGDIAKSIRFGATMVMIGSLLAGHAESPGEIVTVDGVQYKEYFGSASSENKGLRKHVEGKRILQVYRGSLDDTLREMQEDLQSAISYAGGDRLSDLRKCAYVSLRGENSREHLFAAHSSDPRIMIESPVKAGRATYTDTAPSSGSTSSTHGSSGS